MEEIRLDELALEETRSATDPEVRHRGSYPIAWPQGAASSAVVVFELEPGCRLGRHTHTAEEVVLVMAGRVRARVGEEERDLAAGALAVVPALTGHDVANAGDEVARCLGFFPSAAVVTVFDDLMQPGGGHVQGTPMPE